LRTRAPGQHLPRPGSMGRIVRGLHPGVRVAGSAGGLTGEDLAASLREPLAAGRQGNIIRSEPRGQP
jgi:hypothetical protein